jgi:hypothetical protein
VKVFYETNFSDFAALQRVLGMIALIVITLLNFCRFIFLARSVKRILKRSHSGTRRCRDAKILQAAGAAPPGIEILSMRGDHHRTAAQEETAGGAFQGRKLHPASPGSKLRRRA